MDVYFVRHGQTNGNIARRHQHTDTPLNEQGQKQVEAIIADIAALQPTHIITSTQLRAIETTRILTAGCAVIPETHPEFAELIRPESLVGVRFFGFTTVWYVLKWFFGGTIHEGESYHEFRERIIRARTFLESLPADARVVVVSHAVFMNVFLEHLCRDRRMSLWQAIRSFVRIFTLRNASIVHLRYGSGTASCSWQILKR